MKVVLYATLAIQIAFYSLVDAQSEIVVIFNNAPINYRQNFSNGSSVSIGNTEINFINDDLEIEHYSPKYHTIDTLIIKTKRKWVELDHAIQGLTYFKFILYLSDTAVFNYDQLTPILEVRNRFAQPYELNFDYLKSKILSESSYSIEVKCQFPELFNPKLIKAANDNKNFSKIYQEEMLLCHQKILAEHRIERHFLDSIFEKNLISNDMYEILSSRLNYRDKGYEFISNARFYNKKHKGPITTLFPDLNDEKFYSMSFYGYFISVINRHAGMQPASNSQGLNYKAIYDTIASIKYLGQRAKDQLLFRTMSNLIEIASISEIQVYLAKIKKDIHDTLLVKSFKDRFGLNAQVSNDLFLQHPKMGNVSFKDVLKKMRGKVVYVDFWATWCAPCVASLPAAANLRKEYADKNVEFLYLSKDESYDRWIKGIDKHGIANNNSFIIENLFTSRMLEDLKLKTIPRYLIYDQQGNLVHQNAPGPEGIKIRALLDNYLKKN